MVSHANVTFPVRLARSRAGRLRMRYARFGIHALSITLFLLARATLAGADAQA